MPTETIPSNVAPATPAVPPAIPPATNPPVAGAGAKKSFGEYIPEEFRSRPYLKEIAAMEDGPAAREALFKKLDGAETLIGKKSNIPAADASAEEWEKFGVSLRPEKADDYEVVVGEGEKTDPEVVAVLKSALYEAGVPKYQAKKFQEKFLNGIKSKNEALIASRKAEAEAADKKFEDEKTGIFGADKDKAMVAVKSMIDSVAASVPAARERLGKLDDNSLLVLAMFAHHLHTKYVPEDDQVRGGAGGSNNAASTLPLRDELQKIMVSDAYKNQWNPEHEATHAKVREICQKIAAAARKG